MVKSTLALGLTLAACAGAPPRPQAPLIPGGDLVADFTLLRHAYEELHPGLYSYNTPAQLESSFAELRSRVEGGATLPAAYLALSQYLATIRCGHTYANFFNQPESIAGPLFRAGATRLSFLFEWLDGRMIVTRDRGAGLAPGTEVLSVDGVPSQKILEAMLTVARADGHNDYKRVDQLSLHGDTDLEAFDVFFPLLFPQRSEGRFELRTRERALAVSALTYQQRKATVPSHRGDTGPLWTLESAQGTAWLRMPTWALFNSTWDWRAFLADTFQSLQTGGTHTLVIDLRHNEGGLSVGDVLLSHLVTQDLRPGQVARRVRYRKVPADLEKVLDTWDPSFKDWGNSAVDFDGTTYRLTRYDDDERGDLIRAAAPRFSGRVFVVVDASNSSATFEFAQTVQREHLGTLVGEPTGGNQRGINGGAFFFVRLPRTGLEADLPLIAQSTPVERPDAGLLPDIPVAITAADIAAGRDPVKAALSLRIDGSCLTSTLGSLAAPKSGRRSEPDDEGCGVPRTSQNQTR